jgi:hypothetical protein
LPPRRPPRRLSPGPSGGGPPAPPSESGPRTTRTVNANISGGLGDGGDSDVTVRGRDSDSDEPERYSLAGSLQAIAGRPGRRLGLGPGPSSHGPQAEDSEWSAAASDRPWDSTGRPGWDSDSDSPWQAAADSGLPHAGAESASTAAGSDPGVGLGVGSDTPDDSPSFKLNRSPTRIAEPEAITSKHIDLADPGGGGDPGGPRGRLDVATDSQLQAGLPGPGWPKGAASPSHSCRDAGRGSKSADELRQASIASEAMRSALADIELEKWIATALDRGQHFSNLS